MRRLASAAALFALGTVLVACSSTESGSGVPAGSSDTGAPTFDDPSAVQPSDNVPKVPKQLDVSAFIAKPCSVVSQKTVGEFGVSAAGEEGSIKENEKAFGPTCGWNDKTGRAVAVGFLTANKHGLADLYRGQRQGQWGYFEPTSVDGYPAVFADLSDGRSEGTCKLNVAVNDSVTVGSLVQGYQQSCDEAKKFASKVLETLKREG